MRIIEREYMKNKIHTHPSLCFAQDITDICRPITQLDISYFAHVHIDSNAQFSAITNNPGFTEHYLKNRYYNADIHMAEKTQPFNYVIWDALELSGASKKINQEAAEFGIKHVFTIMRQGIKGHDYFHFATHHSSPFINQVYISQLDLLNLFISHFINNIHCSKALSSAYDLKFSLDTNNAAGFTTRQHNPAHEIEKMRANFILGLNGNKGIDDENQKKLIVNRLTSESVSLPPQLYKCLGLLLEGLTAKNIAIRLNLSQRTVENYIFKIRKIIGSKSSKEILASYYINSLCQF